MASVDQTRLVVRTVDLSKIYGDGVHIRALDAVNLTVAQGEMVAVMGASGSGKSTLLNMIGALDRPTSGTVYVDDQDLSQVKSLDRFRAETVGFVFQMHNLIPTLTALENVEVPLRSRRLSGRRRRERAREVLDLVGLSDRAGHLPGQLSGGERQRVAIARALVNEPRLVLADEPTGNLDSVSGNDVMELLTRLNRERGATIVVVTHDRHVARYTQRILTMQDGRIVDEHRVQDPLTEDLRSLAQSAFGQRLVQRDATALARFPVVADGRLTPSAEQLARLLEGLL